MQIQKLVATVTSGSIVATAVAAATLASSASAASWVTAPCVWQSSQKRIQCDGAIMSGQGRSGDFASADAKYAGGVLYQVSCRISTNKCQWIRIY